MSEEVSATIIAVGLGVAIIVNIIAEILLIDDKHRTPNKETLLPGYTKEGKKKAWLIGISVWSAYLLVFPAFFFTDHLVHVLLVVTLSLAGSITTALIFIAPALLVFLTLRWVVRNHESGWWSIPPMLFVLTVSAGVYKIIYVEWIWTKEIITFFFYLIPSGP